MTEKKSRRDFLKHSPLAISLLMSPATAGAEKPEDTNKRDDSDQSTFRKLPYDLSIQNNGTEKFDVTITIINHGSGNTLGSRRYSLPGLNAPGIEQAAEAQLKQNLDISAEDNPLVNISLDNGETAQTELVTTTSGIPDAIALSVRIKPDGSVTAQTVSA